MANTHEEKKSEFAQFAGGPADGLQLFIGRDMPRLSYVVYSEVEYFKPELSVQVHEVKHEEPAFGNGQKIDVYRLAARGGRFARYEWMGRLGRG